MYFNFASMQWFPRISLNISECRIRNFNLSLKSFAFTSFPSWRKSWSPCKLPRRAASFAWAVDFEMYDSTDFRKWLWWATWRMYFRKWYERIIRECPHYLWNDMSEYIDTNAFFAKSYERIIACLQITSACETNYHMIWIGRISALTITVTIVCKFLGQHKHK